MTRRCSFVKCARQNEGVRHLLSSLVCVCSRSSGPPPSSPERGSGNLSYPNTKKEPALNMTPDKGSDRAAPRTKGAKGRLTHTLIRHESHNTAACVLTERPDYYDRKASNDFMPEEPFQGSTAEHGTPTRACVALLGQSWTCAPATSSCYDNVRRSPRGLMGRRKLFPGPRGT